MLRFTHQLPFLEEKILFESDAKSIWNKRALDLAENKRVSEAYEIYKNLFNKKSGHPYSERLFRISALIHWIKVGYLIQNNKTKKEFYRNRMVWTWDSKDYDEIPPRPIFKKLREILANVEEDKTEEDVQISKLTKNLSVYVHRAKDPKFQKLLDEIYDVKRWKKKPRKFWPSKSFIHLGEDFKLARKVSDFVHSQPKQEALRHDILRRFTISKDRLERIDILLAIEGISAIPIKPKRSITGKEPKQIVYKKMRIPPAS